ncbi:lysophospholipid acyltransferase family protein [Methylophilus sp. VKM B-3414]|uniref:lysophospholipid acyltransferase family protein n=1 Tax=Methylophilus sp. VKM B-3414 TaxID=3076121 RepID=UPI0028C890F5|nr:lysophospholipid acyltransferase family protein [Methylophilus sp. VKM B-3414]MDT7849196.1 lysophospholipid acyltransferase family protein [Methylophilus sp. VKM B-3414]
MQTVLLYLRAWLFYVGLFVLTIPFSLLAILLIPLPAVTRSRWVSGWAHAVMWWLKVTCNLRYAVSGREHIPATPSIILAKHQSAWETIALQTILPPQVWVLKRELLMIPFFGWGLWAVGSIPIDRSSGREALKKLVNHGKDRLKRGLWVVIFPEGTRTAPGARAKYHIGGAWLASHTQTAVLPVAHNAGRYWRKNSILKYPGVIQVVIGPAIATNGLKPDALNQQVETWIETEMQHL